MQNPVARYPLDGNARDAGGSGWNGLVYGASFVPGYAGQALSFDGDNDFMVIRPAPQYGPIAQFTICMRAYIDSAQGDHANVRMVRQAPDGRNGFCLSLRQDGRDRLEFRLDNFDQEKFFSAAAPDSIRLGILDAWSHIAFSYSQADARASVFVNGRSVAAVSTSDFRLIASDDLYFGGYGQAEGFHGMFDEIEIYDTCLTADQIKELAGNASN